MSHTNKEQTLIHRINFQNQFTVFSNDIWQDPKLSWAAKGLLGYILSRPDNWKIYSNQLATVYQGNRKGGGIDAIRELIKELIEAGYVIYKKSNGPNGKWVHNYYVYPVKFMDFQKMFPERDFPDLVSTDVVNPCLYKERKETRNDIYKEIINSDPEKAPSPDKPSPVNKTRQGPNNNVFSCIKDKAWIPDKLKVKFTKQHPEDLLQKAVNFIEKQTNLDGEDAKIKYLQAILKDPDAYITALNQKDSKQETQTLMKTLVDGKTYNGWKCDKARNDVTFTNGNASKVFEYNDKNFLRDLNDFMTKAKIQLPKKRE